ncbi:MAG: PQQ-binding-like beta-propeller repeat protein [Prolixibacteraceae bacterium]|jgi:outer membrane protein assembly factor BamB|nr:PQQ-binding-like beta-propeller repeat protein [Prolixibacteraceae bacterium]MBT6006876.1 PQQ-binding-like beta-propeller repeat protein [Prolixibacteraceae bacterium]MBT6765357.1 PQQ-binding-like beta-propeller repeat protein [Prolixibacteraceae bacterium]MBT6998162.1 PQQ-binding-like beta-propeller repeat protein [Prolixibacteraceae bacterium]MBT7395704.1 PQQ-binding-like beta-propeller repeat protein [Prolixibacteraceae bacterium]
MKIIKILSFSKLILLLLLQGFLSCINYPGQAQGHDSQQWGEKFTRNMISNETGLPDSFNPETGENIKWEVSIGSHGYASPVISEGKVLIGANNADERDPRFEGDRGTLLCLNESDGSLNWQLIVPRIEGDRHNDWPMIGICSPPTVEEDRVYILTNRSEVLCLDLNGQADGNDGRFQGEGWFMAKSGEFAHEVTSKDADILWSYDMKLELGLSPHDSPHASILLDGDYLYLNTCNGVDYRHLETTGLNAPSLIALDKKTGRLVAKDDENFGPRIFHSSWSSPSMAEVNNQKLLFYPGPDGILYAFEALEQSVSREKVHSFKKVWQLDCDPAAPKENIHDYLKNREESPINFMGMPVFYNNRIYVTGGGDIWWGKKEAWLKCIDATNGKEIWTAELEEHSASTPAISKGLVYVTDCGKNLHCIDTENGDSYWKHKLKMDSWSSALVADGKVFVGSRGKDFWILEDGKEINVLESKILDSSIHSSPVAANGVLYISTMNRLYAIEQQNKP